MTTRPAHIVRDFLQAFMSGEIARAKGMVCDDFAFRAPLHDGVGGQDAYFAGADEKVRFIRGFRILHQWEDGDEVSTIYELDLGTPANHATMRISEWHSVSEGKVASALMVFDTNATAVHAMRGALHQVG